MSEKQPHAHSVLPTSTKDAAESHVGVTSTGADHQDSNVVGHARRHRRRLVKFLKLSFVAFAVYTLFLKASNNNDNDNDNDHDHDHDDGGRKFPLWPKRRGGCHGRKDQKSKYTFESHFQKNVDKLIAGSLESSIVWDRLAEMTDTYGNRIAGSEALEKSIDWIVEKIKADGLSVTTEEVIVDDWQRNQESLVFLSPTRGPVKLHMLGLGFSPATPSDDQGHNPGLKAEVIVATSKDQFDQLAAAGQLAGRIVLFNKPFESYNSDVVFRSMAATWAQEHGALAVLVRSIGPLSLQSPHTGNQYAASIPAASVSVEDAELLARVLKRHQENPQQFPDWPQVHLTMNAKLALKSKVSRNIIVELKGREKPEEVVVIGGHIDSWDVGSGAVDDGAGCFIAWETLRQLSKLDQPPRRTVRTVFWTSEENGSPGGRVYAANHPETNTSRHVFAFESDNGVFDPYGIKFTAGRHVQENPEKFNSVEFLQAAGETFLGARKDLGYRGAGSVVLPDGGGADIAPLCKQGVACAHFTPADPFPLPYSTSPYYIKGTGDDEENKRHDHHHKHHRHGRRHHGHDHDDGDDDDNDDVDPPRRPVDSGYFYYHHTEADSVGAFTPDQVKNSAAVMAVWTYITAESLVEL
ncbi:hypothetical protein EDD11_006310 [Mortierella claussenii]|nr:hypothetical protein EDD11_006310 [Mortierella claussenii]